MKRRSLQVSLLVSLFSMLVAVNCGGGGGNSNQPLPTSAQLLKRVFVTNEFSGQVLVVDATNDLSTIFRVTVGGSPQFMLLSPGQFTLVFGDAGNTVSIVDNATDTITGGLTLPATTESAVLTKDGKFAFAALPSLGSIAVMDITNRTVTTPITGIPQVRRLVPTPDASKLLAFSDDPIAGNSVTIINTATSTIAATVPGFDRAYSAVISSDNTKAFVLSCGAECGGTQASVKVLDLTNNTITGSVNVAAATVGVSDSSNLFVAGTPVPALPAPSPSGDPQGVLSVISLSTLTVSSTTPISDGLHEVMALAANGKLYVGARRCTNTNNGCLSFYNISAKTATLSPVDLGTGQGGDTVGIQPISDRAVVYVIEGGDLRIYDTATDKLQTQQVEIGGKVTSVKQIN